MFSSKNLFLTAGGDTGYKVNNSLRFRSSASAYLTRNFGASTSGSKTWTWSGWVKRGTLGTDQQLFGNFTTISQNFGGLTFLASNALSFVNYTSSIQNQITTTAVYRDPSSWYHIVLIFDSTQATASNRIQLYVNGVQVTSFSASTYPTLNDTSFWNNSAYNPMLQGAIVFNNSVVNYFDGYMAEVNFIDGQALTPSSFGAYSNYGIWQPKAYTGTYGTNGFYLKFNSFGTAAALGTDSSGNSNTWTVTSISVTAGATYDPMLDSPTLGGSASNYCVLNPLKSNIAPLSANLRWSLSTSGGPYADYGSTSVNNGAWYFEYTITAESYPGNDTVGISSITNPLSQYIGQDADSFSYSTNGYYRTNNVATVVGTSASIGDVVMVAFNLNTGKIWWGKNGTWFGSGDPATGTNAAYGTLNSATSYAPAVSRVNSSGSYSTTYDFNFGQRPFSYTPPTGFLALNAYNLPDPAITNGSSYMAAVTYTGNDTTQTVSNGGNNTLGITFRPDMVWHKGRSVAYDHSVVDVLRGNSNILMTNATAIDANPGPQLDIASTGATVTYRVANLGNNQSAATYSIWQWLGGGTGVSNTVGSVSSTVSANTAAGFSIVTFISPASGNFTVGHGLDLASGVVPAMVIVKNRSGVLSSWWTWHKTFSSATRSYVTLNGTAGVDNTTYNMWGASGHSNTTLGFTAGVSTVVSATEVAYCWAEIPGYSAFGSYTGNGSATDGPFIYLGFRARWIMVKRTDTTGGNWCIVDTSRDTYNVASKFLYPDQPLAEQANPAFDILSNGIKMRNAFANVNASTVPYIYAAFAENPFKYALAR